MPACSKRPETPDIMGALGPVVLLGCGRLGSALVEGWLASGTLAPGDMTLISRSENEAVRGFGGQGVRTGPDALPDGPVTLVLATKPAQWREAVAALLPHLNQPPTVSVSVMAGVLAADLRTTIGGTIARVMPTTAVAERQGVAAIWSADDLARGIATQLFAPMADVVQLDAEGQLDPATAVAGSAPAFIYAFVQALAEAGAAQGLPEDAAHRLACGALRSAASGAASPWDLDALIARIASPGGTTRAGLDALSAGQLDTLVHAAVSAAVARARDLSRS